MDNAWKVTVVIPTYNRPQYVCEAIDSVLNQTYTDFEIIVIDDGSVTDIGETVAHYGSKIRFHKQPNGGLASARNAGLALATGDLIAFLDDDDRWLPHKLENQVNLFRQDPKIDGVYGTVTEFDDKADTQRNHEFLGVSVDIHTILKQHFPPMQTLLVRTSVLKQLNGFALDLKGVEDWDLYLRLFASYKMAGIPEIMAEVRCHGDNMSKNIEESCLYSLKVLDKNRNVHKNCTQCDQVIKETDQWLRDKIFHARREKAISARQKGQKFAMLKWYASALQAYTFPMQVQWTLSKFKK